LTILLVLFLSFCWSALFSCALPIWFYQTREPGLTARFHKHFGLMNQPASQPVRLHLHWGDLGAGKGGSRNMILILSFDKEEGQKSYWTMSAV
jgi:hypothetical protein